MSPKSEPRSAFSAAPGKAMLRLVPPPSRPLLRIKGKKPRRRLIVKRPTVPGRIHIGFVMYLAKAGTRKELAALCRAGKWPRPRRDALSREFFWNKLEVEALIFWRHALKVRRR
jgi:hypothetical protein